MSFKPIGSTMAVLLCCSLLSPGFTYAAVNGQEAQPAAQKYKLTVLESPSTSKRVKKGRVSAEAVVKVTDTNNLPIPGITVTFLLPQAGTSGATFGTGALTSVVTTNAAGVASSGSLSIAAGSSVSVSVSAATPAGVLTTSVPISGVGAAGAAGTAGAASSSVSTGVIVGVAAVVVGAIAAVAATGGFSGKGGGSSTSTTSPGVTVTVGAPASGGITFGPPK